MMGYDMILGSGRVQHSAGYSIFRQEARQADRGHIKRAVSDTVDAVGSILANHSYKM